ncbi:diguanylate cyclase [Advenella kashmirensis W13003]|uniref:Diguanylate cyclase n=1 Tax=Advenella kashmirensis W13003 TaxID=1424334 RepID=V8QUM2_9BURK|nr:hypothetical protein [Advenella kashmirensis]ETF03636.1 diguanylate cyclase [Advenella kashmirensis W13003]
MLTDPLVLILLYFIIPLWLVAGFADWVCHRVTHIDRTSGPQESIFHLLQFCQVGIALLSGLFLEINAGVIAFIIIMFLVHEATAFWDLNYAVDKRKITPIEQIVHSFLEMIPLMAIVCVSALHWGQFIALFGFGEEKAQFLWSWKNPQLPVAYFILLLVSVLLFAVIPYCEELVRCLNARYGWSRPYLRQDKDENESNAADRF